MTLHIGIAGPIASADVAHWLDAPAAGLPRGYEGAPLLATLIGELLGRGHRVSAFTLSSDLPLSAEGQSSWNGPRFDLHCCPMRPRAWPFNGRLPGRIVDLYAFERRGLQRAIAAARPDVVHAHWSYEFAWATLQTGLPHVVTCHDSPFVIARFQRDFRHGAYRWLRAGMAWQVLRRAQRVTTVSPYMVAQVQPLCRVPVGVVPNPIRVPPAVAAPRPPNAPRRIVVVANGFDARKNTPCALAAFAALSADHGDVELRMFGQGHGEGGAAHAWWLASGWRGRVAFLGPVGHSAVLAEIAAADIFLHTSREESFGAVVAEAMAAGVPVIVGAQSGALPWLVERGGILVDIDSSEAVTNACRQILADPLGAALLGAAGRRRVLSSFSVASVADAYEAEYEAALLRPLPSQTPPLLT